MNDELRYNSVFQEAWREAYCARPELWVVHHGMGMQLKGGHVWLCNVYPLHCIERIISVKRTDDIASLSLKILTWMKNNQDYLRMMFPI